MKEYTIARRRIVVQIQTDQIQAETEAEALEIANADQRDFDVNGEENEWQDLNDVIEYPVLTSDDILEVGEYSEAEDEHYPLGGPSPVNNLGY